MTENPFKMPDPPKPAAVQQQASGLTAEQQQYNLQSGLMEQASKSGTSTNPLGTVSHDITGYGPGGVPIYGSKVTLSPEQQRLYDLLTGTQTEAGTAAGKMLAGANYGDVQPSEWIGNETSGETKRLMDMYMAANKPYQDVSRDQLETRLLNRGIDTTSGPGSAGYNAMTPFIDAQNRANLDALAKFEPQAFQQASALFGMPMGIAESLANFGRWQSPLDMAVGTPGATFQAPDVTGAYKASGDVLTGLSAQERMAKQAEAAGWLAIPQMAIAGISGNPKMMPSLGGIGGSATPTTGLY